MLMKILIHYSKIIDAHTPRFADFINNNDIVLDFGSGLGFGANTFADNVSHYVCADVSHYVNVAQQNTRLDSIQTLI